MTSSLRFLEISWKLAALALCGVFAPSVSSSQLDYNGRLSLKQFEELIKPVVDRMDAPIMKALEDAGVTKEQLGSVEIVGGATRYNTENEIVSFSRGKS